MTMKLLTIFLTSAIWLSGCASWGSRAMHIEGNYSQAGMVEGFVIDIDSGADVAGLSGDIVIVSTKNRLDISVGAQSERSLSSPGHEATVDAIKETGKGVAKGMASGAMRGLVPVMP